MLLCLFTQVYIYTQISIAHRKCFSVLKGFPTYQKVLLPESIAVYKKIVPHNGKYDSQELFLCLAEMEAIQTRWYYVSESVALFIRKGCYTQSVLLSEKINSLSEREALPENIALSLIEWVALNTRKFR